MLLLFINWFLAYFKLLTANTQSWIQILGKEHEVFQLILELGLWR
jgi:hypothetical protein